MDLFSDPRYWEDDWKPGPKEMNNSILFLRADIETQDECPTHNIRIDEMYWDDELELTICYTYCPLCGQTFKSVL